jgi:hypothetical protein
MMPLIIMLLLVIVALLLIAVHRIFARPVIRLT